MDRQDQFNEELRYLEVAFFCVSVIRRLNTEHGYEIDELEVVGWLRTDFDLHRPVFQNESDGSLLADALIRDNSLALKEASRGGRKWPKFHSEIERVLRIYPDHWMLDFRSHTEIAKKLADIIREFQ